MIGGIFATELPVGNYRIKSWAVTQGSWSLSPQSPFSLNFTVKPGESVYLGNFHFTETSRNLLMSGSNEVTLQNMASRDIPALQKRFPVLAKIPLTASIADGIRIEKLGGRSSQSLDTSILLFMLIVK